MKIQDVEELMEKQGKVDVKIEEKTGIFSKKVRLHEKMEGKDIMKNFYAIAKPVDSGRGVSANYAGLSVKQKKDKIIFNATLNVTVERPVTHGRPDRSNYSRKFKVIVER